MLIVLLVVINTAASVYLLGFQEPRLTSLQNTWFDKRKQSTLTGGVDAAKVFAQGKKDLAVWDSKILPKKDFARFLGELFETAANNNVAVKGVTYKPKKVKEDGLLAYSFDCSVSGKYAGIKSFIADLNRSRQVLLVDKISFANISQTKEDVDLKVNLTTYFRMEGQ